MSPPPDLPPPADEVTAPWWEATREHRLLVQKCDGCGHAQHPPRALCVGCGRLDPGWLPVDGRGVIDACTVVERAPAPGFDPPYVVARVRLDEGPILLTNIVTAHPYDVQIDQTVWLDWRPLADGRALPIFSPADDEGDAS